MDIDDARFLHLEELEGEYRRAHPLYSKLCKELVQQLDALFRESGVTLAFPIESRVKEWDSIDEKFTASSMPASIDQISDIAGVRVVLLFSRDLKEACKLIEGTFHVEEKEDTILRLLPDQFGYGSIHYQLATPDTWQDVPTLKGLRGLNAEVQVRTAAQHIWAAASHVLQYKHEEDIPVPIRRSIVRAAAMLEIVDLEFERVLDARSGYLVESGSFSDSELLNSDSIRLLLDSVLPDKNRKPPEPYSEILEELRLIEITDIGQLREILERHLDALNSKEAEQVRRCENDFQEGNPLTGTSEERYRKGVYFSHAGLTRNVLELEYGKKFKDLLGELRRVRSITDSSE